METFFQLLIDLKATHRGCKAKLKLLLSATDKKKAVAHSIKELHSEVSELQSSIVKEWKRLLLNYVFMGCLPAGISKAKLYLGEVLGPAFREQLSEKELVFTCHDGLTGTRIKKKANDCTDTGNPLNKRTQRRKRTLKMQMKRRDLTSIHNDASKFGSIDRLLTEGRHLKTLMQELLEKVEAVLDIVSQCSSIFEKDDDE